MLGALEGSNREDEKSHHWDGHHKGWYSLAGLDEDTFLGAGPLLWQHQVRGQARMLGMISNSQPRGCHGAGEGGWSPLTQAAEVRSRGHVH